MMKKNQEKAAADMMKTYMKKEYLIFLFESFHKMIDQEKEFNSKTKGKRCGFLQFICSHYSKETLYAII